MAIDVGPRKPSPEVQERAGALEPKVMHRPPNPWPSRLLWLAGTVLAVVVGLAVFSPGFPEDWVVDAGAAFEDVESWVIENDDTYWLFVYVINPLRTLTNDAFDVIVDVLSGSRGWAITMFASIAGLLAGWRMAVLTAAGFVLMGALGLWEESLETLALVVMMVLGALIIGIPLGIWAGRNRTVERILRPILDGMQTIPAFSYLLPLVLIFSIGTTPALIAGDHLRAAPGGPADRPRAPRRPAELARGRRCVRLDAMAAAVPGAPAAREALDHARREPDDHDGARHGRDRGRGRGSAGSVARSTTRCSIRTSAMRSTRASRSSSWRSSSIACRTGGASATAGLEGAADRRCAALAAGDSSSSRSSRRPSGW